MSEDPKQGERGLQWDQSRPRVVATAVVNDDDLRDVVLPHEIAVNPLQRRGKAARLVVRGNDHAQGPSPARRGAPLRDGWVGEKGDAGDISHENSHYVRAQMQTYRSEERR